MKVFKKSLSLFTCLAVLCAVLFAVPLVSSAAGASETLHLSVEGAKGDIYSGEANFTAGETLYDVLKRELDKKGISNDMPMTSYGRSINLIDGEGGYANNYDTYWSVSVNDAYSDLGVGSVVPKNGDDVVIGLIGYNYDVTTGSMTTYTGYPLVALSEQFPKPGDSVRVTVTDRDTGAVVSGAAVSLNGTPCAPTDANGQTSFTAPSSEGNCTLSVSKDDSDPGTDYSYLVRRTLTIPVGSTQPAVRTIGVTAAGSDRTVDLGGSPVNTVNVTGGGNVSVKLKNDTVPNAFTANLHDSYNLFSISIPAGTAVSGASGWDGTVSLGFAAAPTVPGGSATLAVAVGTSQPLTLTGYARIELAGQSGKSAGYLDESGFFHKIGSKLASDAIPSGFSQPDAFYDDGSNLIIYTRHFSTFVAYTPSAATDVNTAINSAAGVLSASGSDDYWTVFSLSRNKNSIPSAFVSDTAQTLSDNGGSFPRITTLAMTVIALRAAGVDPQSFDGTNLVEQLYSNNKMDTSGLNGPVYALLALDSGKYAVPTGAKWNGASLIADILSYQNTDGGFSLSKGGSSDPDITAMVLTALAPHRGDSTAIATSIGNGLSYLSSAQAADGGFISAGETTESSESAAWTVIALSSLGIDANTDTHFVKNGHSVLQNLMSYRLSDGSFKDKASGGTDLLATQQALMGLEAYQRFADGSPLLFDLTDLAARTVAAENPKTGSAPVAPAAVTFSAASLLLLAAVSKKRSV